MLSLLFGKLLEKIGHFLFQYLVTLITQSMVILSTKILSNVSVTLKGHLGTHKKHLSEVDISYGLRLRLRPTIFCAICDLNLSFKYFTIVIFG